MVYMGSKNRIAKELLSIILKDRYDGQYYVEPFAGGMNMIDKVTGNRIANDLNNEIIAMFKKMVESDWQPPLHTTKEEYLLMKNNQNKYEDYVLGWTQVGCSFRSKIWGGYSGFDKNNRSYQTGRINTLLKQIPNLKGIQFESTSYLELEIPKNSIIYCDPPYANTAQYLNSKHFNYDEFWEWCREKSREGHQVFISEYNAPNDFKCIWQKEIKTALGASKNKAHKESVEKLFIYDKK